MNNRLVGIDILRGISICLMIFINLFDETALPRLLYSAKGQNIDFWVTACVPNIFVFLMGFFFIIANKFRVVGLFKKGIYILFLGYLLNIVRYPVIMYLADMYTSVGEAYAANSYYVHMVDIYIFVGYACLLIIPFSFLPQYYPLYFCLAAWVMYVSDSIVTLKSFIRLLPEDLWEYSNHLFLPAGQNVYFPMFPWLSYLFLGIACGIMYKSFTRHRFYKTVSFMGLLLTFIGYNIFFREYANSSFQMRADFYQHDYTVGILLMGICLLAIPITEAMSVIIPEFIKKILLFTSKNIITLYVISWLITMWGVFSLEWQSSLSLVEVLEKSVYIYIAGLLVAFLKNKITILISDKQ